MCACSNEACIRHITSPSMQQLPDRATFRQRDTPEEWSQDCCSTCWHLLQSCHTLAVAALAANSQHFVTDVEPTGRTSGQLALAHFSSCLALFSRVPNQHCNASSAAAQLSQAKAYKRQLDPNASSAHSCIQESESQHWPLLLLTGSAIITSSMG